jgi:hypothetical protein
MVVLSSKDAPTTIVDALLVASDRYPIHRTFFN